MIWKTFCGHSAPLLGVFFTMTISSGCASTAQLNSISRPGNGTVDGMNTEWQGALTEFKDQGLWVGVQNDSANVFLCLQAMDRGVSRGMLASGVIMWFTPKGGDDRKFGIHFPIGRFDRPPQQDEEPKPVSLADFNELEILGPDAKTRKTVSTLSSEREYGIQAALKDSSGILVYEIKIPRHAKQSTYGIGTPVDNILEIAFETGKLRRMGRPPEGMRGERPPAGVEGPHEGGEEPFPGGGGGRGGARGDRPDGKPRGVETVSLEFQVRLQDLP